jgi:Arc/MetJ family transcription regulator
MRTTLILDDELVAELLQVTQAKTKTDAIHLAIAELIRRKKIEKLKALSGKLLVTDTATSQRRAEKKRQALHQRLWHGRR